MENETGNYDLTILPVKKDVEPLRLLRPVSPMLPDATKGALVLCVSSVRSGKSTLLMNLLCNQNFYRDAFTDVYVFSSTIKSDATSRKLNDVYPGSCFDHFDEGKLARILEHQDSYPVEERPTIAIVLDDLHQIKHKSTFFSLASNYRHHGIGLFVICAQQMKMVPPVVRANVTNLFVGTNSPAQMNQIASEFGEHFGGDEHFKKMHRRAVPERFNFMHARLDQFPATLYKNFEDPPIYTSED